MKTFTFVLRRSGAWYDGEGIALCGTGIGELLGDDGRFDNDPRGWPEEIRLKVALKNPKKRGFVELQYRDLDIHRGRRCQYLNERTRLTIIPLLGLKNGAYIWVKMI